MVVDGDPKSFETAISKSNLIPRIQKDIKTDDRTVPGIDQPADVKTLLFWLFDKSRKENDISDVFTSSTQHTVIMMTKVRHDGYAKVSDVKDKIEPLVRNELKAAKIAEKFSKAIAAGAKTPEALAQKTGAALIPIESLKFGSNNIPSLFNEPKILGAVFGINEKVMSSPIAGLNTVAVIWVEKRDKVEMPKTSGNMTDNFDPASNPQYLSGRIQEVIRKAAHVKDTRYKFEWN
jgi:peptidyl-prolyl cis-trans isomerase D